MMDMDWMQDVYRVVGCDDLEGHNFACCTTLEKAEKALRLLEKEGFEDQVAIIQGKLDVIEIGDDLIQL